MAARLQLALMITWVVAASAHAELVSERWGGKEAACTYPSTLKIIEDEGARRILFDLSALPRDAKIRHASLFCVAERGQPREPIQMRIVERRGNGGKAVHQKKVLELEGPWYHSFDATAAVKRWIKNPQKNLGIAIVRFKNIQASKSYLEVRYEGKPKNLPPQVKGLEAIHHDGQTFLVWKELPMFRPSGDRVVWIEKAAGRRILRNFQVVKKPGRGFMGLPRLPAITLKDLRALQGLAVRDKPIGGMAQSLPPFKRLRKLPEVRYRVYRSPKKLTPSNFKDAEFVGEAKPLCAYQEKMLVLNWKGEYYHQHEVGESIIPTYAIAKAKAVMPGEAFYVHTPARPGKCYYAVTTVMNGTENASEISGENSLEKSIEEKKASPKPVFQFVEPDVSYRGKEPVLGYWHAYWLAPPLANLPDNTPRRVVVGVPGKFKPPGAMVITPHAGNMFFGLRVPDAATIQFLFEQDIPYGGDLCYNEGRGTLRSFRKTKLKYFSERYVLALLDWVRKKWRIDPTKISGGGTHFGIRHPELFGVMWLGEYAMDFDVKWNPGSRALPARLGPKDLAFTENGERGWDVFDIGHFLARNPGRDIPFLVIPFNQPKDCNHGAEFGWQDDPKGLAALRDARQPHAVTWGGPSFSRAMRTAYAAMDWNKSLPAFTHCSLDNNPGNGDPDDGDPWGQINGYLLWENAAQVDEKKRWALTVYLVKGAPETTCRVNITPRHCKNFKPKPRGKYRWTNTSLKDGKTIQSGEVTADRWGLVTIEKVKVSKSKNRLEIFK